MKSEKHTAATNAPGRPGLSFETYEKAYDKLSGPDGTPPSQRSLRKYLGTGSNTTLSNYRRRITEQRLSDEKPDLKAWPDSDILETVHRLAAQIEIREAQIADDRVEEIKKDAQNRIRVAENTMDKRLRDIALLEHRATTAESELVQTRATLRKSEEESSKVINELTHDAQRSKKRNAVLEQAQQDAKRQIAVLTRELQTQQRAIDNANTNERNLSKAANEALGVVQQELTEAIRAHDRLNEQHNILTISFEQQSAKIETKNIQVREMQERVDQTISTREATLLQLNELTAQHTKLIEQLGNARSDLAAEKRAHQTTQKRASQDLSEKNNLLAQMQNILVEMTEAAKMKEA